MIKKIIPLLISIIILLVSISASASIFDGITGKAAEETELINEEVRCVFKDTKLEQGCYSGDDRQLSCLGMDSCTVNVSGVKGQKLKWKSICEDREITTKIDGIHEVVEFKCEEKYDFLRSTPMQLMLFKEQVKCVFANSDSEQKCYSDDNKFSCSGTGSCAIDIAAPGHGMRIIWKSSCGGFAYTNLNETDKTIEFDCQGIKEPYVYEVIEEDVKCIFANSSLQYMCYPDGGKFACSGIGECTVRVLEDKGKTLQWQSSCDRYDYLFRTIPYTVMDGNPEQVEFICRPLPNIILNSGKIYAYLFYREKCDGDCKKIEKALLKYKEKYPQLEVKAFDMAIPENEELFSNIFFNRGHGPDYLPVLFMAGATASSMRYDKRYMDDLDFYIKNCIEHGNCPKPFRSEQEIFIEKNYENYIRQDVWCLFDDPELVKKCTENYDIPECSNTVRKCHTENNEFGCEWDGGIVAAEDGRKYAYCIAMVASPADVTCTNITRNNVTERVCTQIVASPPTTLKWKSSCEGDTKTVIDLERDYIEFQCAQSATPEDISGKGFLHAYWKCQDGTEQKSAEGSDICKTAEEWKWEAKAFCTGKCFKNSMLCGLDEFSVAGECYPETKEEPVIAPVEQEEWEKKEKEKREKEKEEELKKEKPEEPGKPEEKEEFLFCKDSCPSEGKCYAFGYRKEGKFCSDEGLFVEQLTDDAACENNFECQTNVCIDDRCISSGIIQKVIDWIRGLFGQKPEMPDSGKIEDTDKIQEPGNKPAGEDCYSDNECESGVCDFMKKNYGKCAPAGCATGSQAQGIADIAFFCDKNNKWQKIKNIRESCDYDYECFRRTGKDCPGCHPEDFKYYCKDNICAEEKLLNECEKQGLKRIQSKEWADSNSDGSCFGSMAQMGEITVCAPCGNGVCDTELESKCNCPEDCKEQFKN